MMTPNAKSSWTICSRLCKSAVSCILHWSFLNGLPGVVMEGGLLGAISWISNLHIPGPDDGLLTQPAKCFWAHSNYVNWINFSALWRLILRSARGPEGEPLKYAEILVKRKPRDWETGRSREIILVADFLSFCHFKLLSHSHTSKGGTICILVLKF